MDEMRGQMEDELRRNQEEMAAMQENWQQKMAEREKEFQVCEASRWWRIVRGHSSVK